MSTTSPTPDEPSPGDAAHGHHNQRARRSRRIPIIASRASAILASAMAAGVVAVATAPDRAWRVVERVVGGTTPLERGLAVLIAIIVMVAAVCGMRPMRWPLASRVPGRSKESSHDSPAGAGGFYAVAVMSMGVSVDTSWRFFGDVLGITNPWERAAMFAVVEVALVACGYGMRANVRKHGKPGTPRLIAWALCALAAYMALYLSGPLSGIARVALGPVLGMVVLHAALGIEVRHKTGERSTIWLRIGRELRERALSRFGLGDDDRDAAARSRERAARTAARLALPGGFRPFREWRYERALRTSRVAHDPTQMRRMLDELAVLRFKGELADLAQDSPWKAKMVAAAASPAQEPKSAAPAETEPAKDAEQTRPMPKLATDPSGPNSTERTGRQKPPAKAAASEPRASNVRTLRAGEPSLKELAIRWVAERITGGQTEFSGAEIDRAIGAKPGYMKKHKDDVLAEARRRINENQDADRPAVGE